MENKTSQNDDLAKRTLQYIQIRDALKALDAEWEAKRKPLLEVQEMLAGIIRKFMDDNKLDSLKTAHGTCYTSTRYTATLADPAAFMDYVINSKRWELLERRANATAVADYVKENNALPAGCNLNAIQTLGVRRK